MINEDINGKKRHKSYDKPAEKLGKKKYYIVLQALLCGQKTYSLLEFACKPLVKFCFYIYSLLSSY